MKAIKENDMAPDFTAETASGREVHLSELRGSNNVVLYFYPKDDTPGCTVEAKEFTEFLGQFSSQNTVVWGVSYDDPGCHQAFIDKYGLKIELLSDQDHRIAKLYGCDGKDYPSRDTFLIDKQGKVRRILRGVKPQGHAKEVLGILKQAA